MTAQVARVLVPAIVAALPPAPPVPWVLPTPAASPEINVRLDSVCRNGAVIDRVDEGRAVIVLGASGVRTIAVNSLAVRPRDGAVREGMTLRPESGRCLAEPPDPAALRRVRLRLRALSLGAP